MQTLIIPLAATWRDLVPWIPVVVIIAVLYSFGIRIRVPGPWNRYWDDDDKV